MGLNALNINKLNGGLESEAPNTDRILMVAMPIATLALPAGMVHYTPKKVLQPSDAAALGITEAFDANNLLLHKQQIDMVFKYCPNAELHIIPVPDTLTVTQLTTTAAFLSAVRTVKTAKILAIAIAADVTTTFGHVAAVQAMVNAFAAEHRLIDSVILPTKGNAAPMTIADYPDFRTKNAAIVTPCIAQDPAIAGRDAAYAKYADWGSVLGGLAVRQINESLGSTDIIKKPNVRKGDPDYKLTDDVSWIQANLSSGVSVDGLTPTDLASLTAKGYVFVAGYDGYDGMFFNSSPTSVAYTSDFAYIERNCVWNKAARSIRTALVPKIKGVVKKDPATGYIKTTTISSWTGICNKALEAMQKADEISGFNIYINPKQVLSETSPLKIKATVVADGIVHSFDVDLGLANKI